MCVALSSGTSAVMYSLINIMSQGDNFISSSQLYGGTYTMFDNILPEYGINAKKVDVKEKKGQVTKTKGEPLAKSSKKEAKSKK